MPCLNALTYQPNPAGFLLSPISDSNSIAEYIPIPGMVISHCARPACFAFPLNWRFCFSISSVFDHAQPHRHRFSSLRRQRYRAQPLLSAPPEQVRYRGAQPLLM